MSDTPRAPHPDTEARERLAASIAALRVRFREVTRTRAAEVEAAALAQAEGALDEEQRASAERAAHKLAGSLGTYGHPNGSRIAREIELLLGSGRALHPGETLQLGDLVLALQQELERDPAEPAAPASPEAARPQLWLRSGDEELAARVLMEAAGRGIGSARVRASGLGGATLAGTEAAQVVVFDLAGDLPGELDELERLAHAGSATAIIVLAQDPPLAARLACAQLGARLLLEKPVSPQRLVDAAESLLRERPAAGRGVAGLLGDPAGAARVGEALAGRGLTPHLLHDPEALWPLLESVRPDALLVDLDMPEALALCRAVRADPRWGWMAVIALCARVDGETLDAAMAAGVDDLVSAESPVLAARVEARLLRVHARLQAMGATGATDPLTGLWLRPRLDEAVARLTRLARRHREPLALAVVALDDLAGLGERWGQASTDQAVRTLGRLLRESLRDDDVLGRTGAGEFTLALYPGGAEEAGERLRAVLDRFRERLASVAADDLPASFRAGVAELPRDGEDPAALRAAALSALHHAPDQGVADRPGEAAGALDVVVVEDDDTIAGLLLYTLRSRGYSAEWIADGTAALAALAGPGRTLRPRVILLDVDLPGRDGLGVLRELAQEGVLASSRVIMLTVRSGENEVVQAMRAGAFDHVAKPFSPQVLVHRIERALRAG